MKRKNISTDIGLSDAEIQSYRKDNDTVVVTVMAWNESCLEIVFNSVLRLLDNDAGDIERLCEIEGKSDFLQAAVDRVYDVTPSQIPYRHYQFIGIDGEPVFDVVAEDVSVSVV